MPGARPEEPVAIVSMGCIVPGSVGPEELWRQILQGVSGICDATELNPLAAEDHLFKGPVTPDKTYTLLGGFIRGFQPDPPALPPSSGEAAWETRGQQLLAEALSQCLRHVRREPGEPSGLSCFLGSTADGWASYDEGLLAASLHHLAQGVASNPEDLAELRAAIDEAIGLSPADIPRLLPWTSAAEVCRRLIGPGVRVVLADTACSSSLYALDMGVKALRLGECGLAICGGVFTPGPSNSCLFAQFQGLSATGSRPLDASADGVVFGEGAAVVALRRLSDAVARGDHVHAVIRSVGLSSDGKSPSVMEPRSAGQALAVRRALDGAGIAPERVQFIEAHATATPRGDAVELVSLSKAFAGVPGQGIEIQSVKALVGHLGWVAGVASVIKVCLALEKGIIPPQSNFTTPNPKIDWRSSPFTVSTAPRPWPAPESGAPRLAGVNGFGFGGSNAHVILEEYRPGHHGRAQASSRPSAPAPDLVVVGAAGLRPATAPHLRFDPGELGLPPGVLILPEVVDGMDPGQLLAVRAVYDILQAFPEEWERLREETAVVLGVEGKTGRGIRATLRVQHDRLRRRLTELQAAGGSRARVLERTREALLGRLRALPPSGPYTLLGLMPNVIPGRVANAFNLSGPNLALDGGAASFPAALELAARYLRAGDCRLAFAGGVSGYAGPEVQRGPRATGEGIVMVALTTSEVAEAHRLKVLARLDLDADATGHAGRPVEVGHDGSRPALPGAEGGLELLAALEEVRAGGAPVLLRWPSEPGRAAAVRLASPTAAQAPILQCTPRLVPAGAPDTGHHRPLRDCRLLVLTDAPGWLAAQRGALEGIDHRVLCTRDAGTLPGAVAVDLSSEETALAALARLPGPGFDVVLAVQGPPRPQGVEAVSARPGSGRQLLDLLFVTARHLRERLAAGTTRIAALVAGAWEEDALAPVCGLLAGFFKSIARELPAGVRGLVATDEEALRGALPQLEVELASGPGRRHQEVYYRRGVRHVLGLEPRSGATAPGAPLLGPDSVVLATGGGRGVTAALVEALKARHGCTVVLLGRSDPASVPAPVLRMSEAQLSAYETDFYREQLAAGRGPRMAELKQRFQTLAAGWEVARTLERLARTPGEARYVPADVTDEARIDEVVAGILRRHGRVDLVLHGAGLQSSKLLARKELPELRRVVSTKLDGLVAVHRALERHQPGRPVHFHLLTSAFSFMGNDGQPDYGAANEAMNHLAARSGAAPHRGSWSTIAWLGWAGVGMTRGSEYATLARSRGLRPVERTEGQALFSAALLEGPPAEPVNVLMAQGEATFYGVELLPPAARAGPARPPAAPTPDLVRAVTTEGGDFRASELATTFEAERSILWCHQVPRGLPSIGLPLLEDFERLRSAAAQAVALLPPGTPFPVRYVVLASRVPGIFSLGGDLQHLTRLIRHRDRDGLVHFARLATENIHRLSDGFGGLPVVTVALVQGAALGGGFEEALAANVLVAERSATFQFPEVMYDWFPGMGAYSFLVRRVGHRRAQELIVQGKRLDASALHGMGLVDVLCEDGAGAAAVRRYADEHRALHGTLLSVQMLRRRHHLPPLEELMDIVVLWVDRALALTDRELERLDGLIAAQRAVLPPSRPPGRPEAPAGNGPLASPAAGAR